jgi:hypothetical protein
MERLNYDYGKSMCLELICAGAMIVMWEGAFDLSGSTTSSSSLEQSQIHKKRLPAHSIAGVNQAACAPTLLHTTCRFNLVLVTHAGICCTRPERCAYWPPSLPRYY